MAVRQILDRLVIGGVLIVSAVAYEALPVLICGLLVVGSGIPIAIRAIRSGSRLAGNRNGVDLEAMLSQRFGDLEDRLCDMEYRNTQLLESVEERIDWAEKLLMERGKPVMEPHMGLPEVTPIQLGRMPRA